MHLVLQQLNLKLQSKNAQDDHLSVLSTSHKHQATAASAHIRQLETAATDNRHKLQLLKNQATAVPTAYDYCLDCHSVLLFL